MVSRGALFLIAALAAAAIAPLARAQSKSPDPGFEIPAGVDLTLPGDAPPPSASGGTGPAVPGGMDLDVVPAPTPADGQVENPLDRDFETALAAYRDRDFAAARTSWEELSDAGHELSMHNLAVLLWRGQGGKRDPERALELFRDAGEKQVPQSLHALGTMYLKGLGVPKDAREAVRYFGAASSLGYPPSTYNLALANFSGIGGADDTDLGMELMRAAAESGLTRAQYDLAGLLYHGTYGRADPTEARQWFERATDGGDPFAAYNLALMQLAGTGGPARPDDAFDNLKRSAEAGTVPAQVRLALVLASGEAGRKRDLEGAYRWFAVAAGLGDKTAKENLKRLAPGLTDDQIARARKAAKRFRPMPFKPAAAQMDTVQNQ